MTFGYLPSTSCPGQPNQTVSHLQAAVPTWFCSLVGDNYKSLLSVVEPLLTLPKSSAHPLYPYSTVTKYKMVLTLYIH